MIFSNIWGLFGFLGIIALIIIYILKPKYQDKTISSTYIWKLSLKYRRPKTPFDWLQSSLLFLIQLLVLTLLGLLMLKPNYAYETDSNEKIVILDASASLYKADNRFSSFDRAKNEIITLASNTTPKDKFSVIIATNDPYYAVRRSDSLDYIKQSLTNINPTYEEVDLTLSINLLDTLLRENPEASIYLYTDKEVMVPKRINVKKINSNEWNVGILDFVSTLKPNGYYMFEADIINYGGNDDFTLTLYVDGKRKTGKIITANDFNNSEIIRISFDEYQTLTFEDAYLTIDTNDGYSLDNEFRIYGQLGRPLKVLLFSDSDDLNRSTLYYVRSALESLNKRWSIDTFTKEEDLEYSDYDLYIYDTYIPDVLPIDGAIWLFNPNESSINIPITISDEINGSFNVNNENSNSLTYRQIMKGINSNKFIISKYQKVNSYPEFEMILSINSDPLLLTKNVNNQKITIFSFDLSFSNLPILVDFPLLIKNIFEYSVPTVINTHLYETGTLLNLEARSNTKKIVITKDDDELSFNTFPVTFSLDKPGTYSVIYQFNDDSYEKSEFFVRVSKNESFQNINGGELILMHNPNNNKELSTDIIDLIPYLSAFLLLLLLIEWGVQYREQY